MFEPVGRMIILIVVVLFLLCSLTLARPLSGGGKLSLKLFIVNAFGWLALLPFFGGRGDPPSWLIFLMLFWLVNLVLLPAGIIAVWVAFREHEEKIGYLALASAYALLNVITLFVFPLIWLFRNR
jgi:hypothetical protein